MARSNKGLRRIASGDKVELFIDLSDVEEFLAAGDAIVKSLKTKRYQNALWDAALAEADTEFNIEAAAYAMATGNIAHMYEWGTAGINKGRSNVRPNPMSKGARLWQTASPGTGFTRTITYYFLPSFANVPKPTTTDSGMSQEVISKMRDHVFRWKAEYMEWGREVIITPDKAKFLLIPISDENRQHARPYEIKRGYFLSKGPITFNAGGNRYANHFTQFFVNYWLGKGDQVLNDSVKRQVLLDYNPKFRTNKMFKSLKPAGGSVQARVAAASKRIQAEVEQEAVARAMAVQARGEDRDTRG